MISENQALGTRLESILTPRQFALLFGCLAAVCFPTVLIGLNTFFFRDYAFFGYPLAAYHRESFWAGEIPLWNPYNNSGIPFLAQWNTMVLYPGSLIYLLLPLPWSLSLFCLAHFYLAGIGMYQLARNWTGQNLAAALAGVAYAFSGLVLCCLKWPNNIAALGWMPLVVLAVQQAWDDPRKYGITAVLFGTMQMLTGAPEVILFTWGIAGLLWIFDCIRQRASASGRRIIAFPLIVLGISGLAAAQLLPFLELLMHSQRDRHFGGAMWPMPATGLANFFLPLFNTFASYYDVPAQPNQYWISTYYLSLPVLAFAIYAIVTSKDPRNRLLGTMALGACILALGSNALVYDWLRKALPFLSFMRFPIKFIVATSFILPILSAFGVRELLNKGSSKSLLGIFILLGIAPLGLALLSQLQPEDFQHRPGVWKNAFFRTAFLLVFIVTLYRFLKTNDPKRISVLTVIICIVVWGDAVTHSPWQNPTVPSWAYAGQAAELHPRPQLGESRAMISPEASAKLDHLLFESAVEDVMASRMSLYANANLLEDIPKVDGFYALYLQHMDGVERVLYNARQPTPALLDFMAVSHVTAPQKTRAWAKRETAMPWVSGGQTPVYLSERESLNRLATSFKPQTELILPAEMAPLSGIGTNVQVHSSRISAHTWFMEVEAAQKGMVAFSQAYHPRWKATIDGEPAELLRANAAFQAIVVPEGRHSIQLRYVDAWFRTGGMISFATLILLILLDRWKVRAAAV